MDEEEMEYTLDDYYADFCSNMSAAEVEEMWDKD